MIIRNLILTALLTSSLAYHFSAFAIDLENVQMLPSGNKSMKVKVSSPGRCSKKTKIIAATGTGMLLFAGVGGGLYAAFSNRGSSAPAGNTLTRNRDFPLSTGPMTIHGVTNDILLTSAEETSSADPGQTSEAYPTPQERSKKLSRQSRDTLNAKKSWGETLWHAITPPNKN